MHDDSTSAIDEQPSLRLLHYADVENTYDDPDRVGALAGLIDARRDDNALVLGAGDNTALGPLALLTDEGRAQALPFFERVSPDADTFGNHDFDFGCEWAVDWAERVPTTYCCANVEGPGTDRVPDGTVFERGGARVGVVGLAHPGTADICGAVEDAEFTDPVDAATAAFDDLGPVDYRVVLAHCGEFDPEIAAGVEADVILGGHVHERRTERVNGTLLVRTGGNGTELAEVTFSSEPAVEYHEIDPGTEPDGSGDGPDSATDVSETDPDSATDAAGTDGPFDESLAATYRDLRRELGVDEVVARVDGELPRTNRERYRGESRLGNFAADALRAEANADVGLFPGGSLRAGAPLSGEVTLGEVVSCCPFGGSVVEVAFDGVELQEVLAEAAHPLPGDRGWVQFHVSGLDVVWTDGNELQSATVDGDPIDPDEAYRVATPEYVVVIDGFGPLRRENAVAEHESQWEALVSHARDGGLDVGLEGRIERVTAQTTTD